MYFSRLFVPLPNQAENFVLVLQVSRALPIGNEGGKEHTAPYSREREEEHAPKPVPHFGFLAETELAVEENVAALALGR